MTKLHLVRHGETDWNVEKRYQGSQDIPLNERGRLQAEEVAKAVMEMPLAGIYSSNLKRALETAQIINRGKNHVIEQFEQLREGFYGSLEGKTLEEVQRQFPHINSKEELSNAERLHSKLVPDMESGFEIASRAIGALEIIAKRHPSGDILVVTHGGVIRNLLVYLADYDWTSISIKNGELVTFFYDGNTFKHQQLRVGI